MLNNIIQQIETLKAQNGGKLVYGMIRSIVDNNKVTFPWLDVNKVTYHTSLKAMKLIILLAAIPKAQPYEVFVNLAHHIALAKNEAVEIIESEKDAFRCKTKFTLHPEKFLFVDEGGSNTLQKSDGHCGGEKLLVPKDIWPQICAAVKDSHFTALGFTAKTGAPVCCAIVVAAKQMDPQWLLVWIHFEISQARKTAWKQTWVMEKCFHSGQSAHSTINKF